MKTIRTRTDPVTGEIYEIVREEVGDPVTLEYLERMGIVKHDDAAAHQRIETQNNISNNEYENFQ